VEYLYRAHAAELAANARCSDGKSFPRFSAAVTCRGFRQDTVLRVSGARHVHRQPGNHPKTGVRGLLDDMRGAGRERAQPNICFRSRQAATGNGDLAEDDGFWLTADLGHDNKLTRGPDDRLIRMLFFSLSFGRPTQQPARSAVQGAALVATAGSAGDNSEVIASSPTPSQTHTVQTLPHHGRRTSDHTIVMATEAARPKTNCSKRPRRRQRRCAGAPADPLYVAYTNNEWGVALHSDRQLVEMLCLRGCPSGVMSWVHYSAQR